MSVTKEIIDQEALRVKTGVYGEIHLHKEGTFLRAYDWSAWLCCRYLHEFKVNKRTFKGIDEPVAYIGFPETSLAKWMPEGAATEAVDEKHVKMVLPPIMLIDDGQAMESAYGEWKAAIPLTEMHGGQRKREQGDDVESLFEAPPAASLTSIMQRVLAYPIESKSPIECMTFLADVKQRLAKLF